MLRKILLGALAPATVLGGVALGGAANAATPPAPIGYTASIGDIPVTVSANDGGSAVVNAADTLTLTLGAPPSSDYAQAVLGLPAGSVLPDTAPSFTTDNYAAGSPRFVFILGNGDIIDGYPAQLGTAANTSFTGDQWTAETATGVLLTSPEYTTYADAVAAAGGYGETAAQAYVVADGDQPDGTADTISRLQYDGEFMTVKPVYAPVPRLSKGHAVSISPVREDVYFTQSGVASCDHFTIAGPGAINGHQGWVNGKIGLNEAVYGGLEAGHGYTVFYQPVTGSCALHGTTAVPGSHFGYVYFETAANG